MATKTYYLIVVDTNKYAGNFERELCAHLTGQYGECGVGDHIAKQAQADIVHLEWWEEHTLQMDEEGDHCERPVIIVQNPNWVRENGFVEFRSVGIYVDTIPPVEVMDEFKERVAWTENNMATHLGRSYHVGEFEGFKIEGLRLIKREKVTSETVINDSFIEF